MKEVKVVVRDLRKEISEDLMKSYEKEFLEMKMKGIKREKEEVKKDTDEDFLFTCEKLPKMKKREVTRMKLKGPSHRTTFSDFQCDVCKNYLSNKTILKQHYERHFEPLSYDCKKCEKKFAMKYFFINHTCSFSCHHCERNFPGQHELKIHMKRAHKTQLFANMFSCDFCGDCFNKKKPLKVHIVACNLRQQRKFRCDHCGKNFETKVAVSQHIKTHAHDRVECKICRMKLKPKCFERHTKRFHPKREENFKCQICLKSFKSSVHLKDHMNVHTKRFQCSYCDKKFPTPSKLQKHMIFHENPEEFQCKICGHQSTTKQSLELHERTHNKDREKHLKCHRCDYKTDTQRDLREHLKAHERRDKKLSLPDSIECKKCSSVLKNEELYKIHLRTKHGNRKEFECDLCGYRSTQRSNMKRHILNKHLK